MQKQYMSRYATRRSDDDSQTHRRITVDISLNSMLLVLGILVAIFLSGKLIKIAALVFFAFIISSAALPLIRWFMEKGLSKWLSIFLTYLFGLIIILGSVMLIFLPFFSELQRLIIDFPTITQNFVEKLNSISFSGFSFDSETIKAGLNEVAGWLGQIFSEGGLSGLIGTAANIGGGLLSILTAILLSVYIIVDHDNFVDLMLLRIIDDSRRRRVRQLVFDVEDKLGSWMLGQTMLSFIIGVIVWIFLTLVGVPFALPLAVLAGLLESIPSLGPSISAVPAILLAFFANGPVSAVIVTVGYMIIQQLENSFIVPKIMANAVGLKPIIVILAVAVGFTLAGPIGALLSVPIAVLLQIAYEFYIDLQKLRAKGIV